MTTSQHRIDEFSKRQVYYDSSVVIKLSHKPNKWHYQIWGWINQKNIDTKCLIKEGPYNLEDPLELIKQALQELKLKKIKLGVPQ